VIPDWNAAARSSETQLLAARRRPRAGAAGCSLLPPAGADAQGCSRNGRRRTRRRASRERRRPQKLH